MISYDFLPVLVKTENVDINTFDAKKANLVKKNSIESSKILALRDILVNIFNASQSFKTEMVLSFSSYPYNKRILISDYVVNELKKKNFKVIAYVSDVLDESNSNFMVSWEE